MKPNRTETRYRVWLGTHWHCGRSTSFYKTRKNAEEIAKRWGGTAYKIEIRIIDETVQE